MVAAAALLANAVTPTRGSVMPERSKPRGIAVQVCAVGAVVTGEGGAVGAGEPQPHGRGEGRAQSGGVGLGRPWPTLLGELDDVAGHVGRRAAALGDQLDVVVVVAVDDQPGLLVLPVDRRGHLGDQLERTVGQVAEHQVTGGVGGLVEVRAGHRDGERRPRRRSGCRSDARPPRSLPSEVPSNGSRQPTHRRRTARPCRRG